jgi:MFS family permease
MQRKAERGGLSPHILTLGGLVLLLITSLSILHPNEYEFVYVRFETITLFQLSLFDTLLYAAYLIFGLLTGMLSDRLGKRRIFVILGSSSSVLFFLLMTQTSSFALLLLFRFLQGGCSVMGWQTLMTLALDRSDLRNRGVNMGVFGSFLALAMGTGPVLGGVLASRNTFLPYYAAIALNLVVAGLAALLLQEPSKLTPRRSLKESFVVLKQKPVLSVPALFNFVDRLHVGFVLYLLPLFIEIRLGLGPSWRGMMLGIFALPYILLHYPVGRLSDRVGRLPLLVPGAVLFGVLFSVSGYIGTGFGITAAVFATLGIFSGLTGPTNAALVGDLAETDENGMAMALFNFAGNLGIICGPLVAGRIMDSWNMQGAFFSGGLIELSTLGIGMLLLKQFGFSTSWTRRRT